MILVGLKGGLGNQLFQYALGRRLAFENNLVLKLNNSKYKKNSERQFELKYFDIKAEMATGEEIKWFHHQISKRRLVNAFLPYYRRLIVYEKTSSYDPNILKANLENAYFIGYWQAEKYFKSISEVLKKDLSLKNPGGAKFKKIQVQMKKLNSVSLHIRRGDHLTALHQTTKVFQNISYYYDGIKLITRKLKNPVLFVSSDDISWVRKNLVTTIPTFYVSDEEILDAEEMILMSCAKHNIIANSTLSWWGAWLNGNPNKIVVCPKLWFVGAERNKLYTNDLLPKSWLKI